MPTNATKYNATYYLKNRAKVLAANNRNNKTHYDECKRLGVCVVWGCGQPTDGRTRCKSHSGKQGHTSTLALGMCVVCNKPFIPLCDHQRTCSKACAHTVKRQRDTDRRKRKRIAAGRPARRSDLNTKSWTKDQWRAYHASWHQGHKDAKCAAARKWGREHVMRVKMNGLCYKYEMVPTEHARLLSEQENRCK